MCSSDVGCGLRSPHPTSEDHIEFKSIGYSSLLLQLLYKCGINSTLIIHSYYMEMKRFLVFYQQLIYANNEEKISKWTKHYLS